VENIEDLGNIIKGEVRISKTFLNAELNPNLIEVRDWDTKSTK
jgi:hypothetical protein